MAEELSEQEQQIRYRDARFTNQYNDIWQSVGKCVFCDLNEKYVFFEEHGVVMTISLYAYIDGHFMIIPRRHVRSPKELTQVEWETIRKFIYIAQKLIKDVHHVTGMQVIEKSGATAQSTVNDHLHFHCVPFDAPDLCEWNYRKLRYTPLENVALYKKARKDIISHGLKFEKKYKQQTELPVICDVAIFNTKNEILLQERKKNMKLTPDWLTIPGGHIDNFTVSFEEELAREVKEEIGLDITAKRIHLHASRVGGITSSRYSKQLKVTYPEPKKFVWNTYVLKDVDPNIKLTPGDDCDSLLWVPVEVALKHERVSEGIRETIQGIIDAGR
jgi:diadenosine tetraphosphate (Ap4A) HIT family hydrolase/8-oxo-dGTP pyrophosphatase MutT (NUDIX family)